MTDPSRNDGQVLPLVALLVVVAGFLGFGLARLGIEAVAVASGQTAADAAALAGAIDGRAAADAAASANHAHIERFQHTLDGRTCVTVRRGPAEARACARLSTASRFPGGRGG